MYKLSACAAVALLLSTTSAPAREPIKRPPDTARNRMLLADTMGAMHYLTIACSGLADQSWRARMAEMMQIEPLSSYERQDLVAAFNRGYRQEKYYYPQCTPRNVSQIQVQKRFKAEQGQILSAALADPYLH
jgi:uncharacterized protein (TIGR02301 family)